MSLTPEGRAAWISKRKLRLYPDTAGVNPIVIAIKQHGPQTASTLMALPEFQGKFKDQKAARESMHHLAKTGELKTIKANDLGSGREHKAYTIGDGKPSSTQKRTAPASAARWARVDPTLEALKNATGPMTTSMLYAIPEIHARYKHIKYLRQHLSIHLLREGKIIEVPPDGIGTGTEKRAYMFSAVKQKAQPKKKASFYDAVTAELEKHGPMTTVKLYKIPRIKKLTKSVTDVSQRLYRNFQNSKSPHVTRTDTRPYIWNVKKEEAGVTTSIIPFSAIPEPTTPKKKRKKYTFKSPVVRAKAEVEPSFENPMNGHSRTQQMVAITVGGDMQVKLLGKKAGGVIHLLVQYMRGE